MPKAISIIMTLCAWLPAAAPGANLIRDPGAENPVSIADYPDADNLAARCPDGFYAPGWGVYNGGCSLTWGVTSAEPHSGDHAVFMRIVRPVAYKGGYLYSGALLLGEGNGYNGENALALNPATRYKFTVWLKTSAPHPVDVYLSGYLWRRGKHERRALPLPSLLVDGKMAPVEKGMSTIMADGRWRRIEGVFESDESLETANVCFGVARSFERLEAFQSVTLFIDDAEVTAQ